MIKLDRPVIVEGKYDVIKLSNILDALIIKTDGFGIFKDKEKQQLVMLLPLQGALCVFAIRPSVRGGAYGRAFRRMSASR